MLFDFCFKAIKSIIKKTSWKFFLNIQVVHDLGVLKHFGPKESHKKN